MLYPSLQLRHNSFAFFWFISWIFYFWVSSRLDSPTGWLRTLFREFLLRQYHVCFLDYFLFEQHLSGAHALGLATESCRRMLLASLALDSHSKAKAREVACSLGYYGFWKALHLESFTYHGLIVLVIVYLSAYHRRSITVSLEAHPLLI